MAQVVPYLDAAIDTAEFIDSNPDRFDSFRKRFGRTGVGAFNNYQPSGQKRSALGFIDPPSKRLRDSTSSRRYTRKPMRFRNRRFRRRTFRRRFRSIRKRRSFRSARRIFTKAVASVSQSRKVQLVVAAGSLKPTDASAPNILVLAPYTYGLSQGVGVGQFTGDTIFLRGIRVRADFRLVTSTTTNLKIRCWLMRSRNDSAVTVSGTVYNSTTTDVANPAAISNQNNVRMFDSTLNAWSEFVGDNITTPFDTTEIKILKMKHTGLTAFGVTGTTPVKLVDWWFPINKKWTIQDPGENGLSAPMFGKWFTYYLCIQCFDGISNIDNNNRLAYDLNVTSYWKDTI